MDNRKNVGDNMQLRMDNSLLYPFNQKDMRNKNNDFHSIAISQPFDPYRRDPTTNYVGMLVRYNYSIIRYNYELNSIDDTTISLTSTPIMNFILTALPNILLFKLTIRYNDQLNSNGQTAISLTSTLITIILDNYYINYQITIRLSFPFGSSIMKTIVQVI